MTLTACSMQSPAELRTFRADYDLVAKNSKTAASYLEFADAAAEAQKGMRRTYEAALECGHALKRIHETESYKDTYPSWSAMIRSLGMSRSNSYRLMGLVDAPPADPEDESLPIPDTVDADVDVDVDVDEPETEADPFAGLREQLASMGTQPDDDRQPSSPRDATWVERQTISLAKWFEHKSIVDRARPHLEALVELAKQAG